MAKTIIPNAGRIFDGVYSHDPYWIFVSVPYAFVDTFDRHKMATGSDNGFRVVTSEEARRQANQTRAPILFDQQVIRWSLQDAKASHIHGLSLEMVNQDNNLHLFQWVNPGDWCLFWVFNNRADFERIRARLISAHGCQPWDGNTAFNRGEDNSNSVNGFNSGLKFVGRVTSLQHHEARLTSGQFNVGWQLQAQAFSELDMTIYYNDLIAFKYDNAYQFWPDFGVNLKKLLNNDPGQNKGYINTDAFVPAVVKIGLGVGPGELTKDRGDTEVRKAQGGDQLAASPNVSFEVPAAVLGMLNRATDTSGTYADILTQIVGVQTYGSQDERNAHQNVLPNLTAAPGETTIFYADKKLNDYYPPDPFSFKDRSIWSFIESYLNQPINEAYTALRPHPVDGSLLPTLVIRRVPYSSDEYAAPQGAATADNFLDATPFSALPRWAIANEMIYSIQIGRSDALRFNYVHLTPSTLPSKDPTGKERLAYALTPPLVDEASIRRHGLRMMNTRIAGYGDPSFATKNKNPAQQYSSFMADVLMEAHLRLSGNMTCCGIQDCIQPGDNLYFNGVLYHIETVSHSGSIGLSGEKTFTTQIAMSHGVPVRILGQQGRLQEPDTQDFINTLRRLGTDENVTDSLQKDLDDLRDPKSDKIYDLRNRRQDLEEVGLVGAKTAKDLT